jgi:hypothetical protein
MIRKNTWIILGAFAIVLIGAIVWQYGVAPKVNVEPTPTVQPVTSVELFPNVDQSMVASLKLQSVSDQKELLLTRDASGEWAVTVPTTGTTDTNAATSLVSQVVALRTLTTMNPSSDLSVYGLSTPTYIIKLTLNGGESHIINVGDAAPTGNAYYIQLDGGKAEAVSNYDLDSILASLSNPPFQPTATPEVSPTSEVAPVETTPVPVTETVEAPTSTP